MIQINLIISANLRESLTFFNLYMGNRLEAQKIFSSISSHSTSSSSVVYFIPHSTRTDRIHLFCMEMQCIRILNRNHIIFAHVADEALLLTCLRDNSWIIFFLYRRNIFSRCISELFVFLSLHSSNAFNKTANNMKDYPMRNISCRLCSLQNSLIRFWLFTMLDSRAAYDTNGHPNMRFWGLFPLLRSHQTIFRLSPPALAHVIVVIQNIKFILCAVEQLLWLTTPTTRHIHCVFVEIVQFLFSLNVRMWDESSTARNIRKILIPKANDIQLCFNIIFTHGKMLLALTSLYERTSDMLV